MENNKNYDEYIVFLLGTDTFEVCDAIRTLSASYGIDTMYEKCIYIAKKFEQYDKVHKNNSQYDSFCIFLQDYEKEIDNYLCNSIEFNVN